MSRRALVCAAAPPASARRATEASAFGARPRTRLKRLFSVIKTTKPVCTNSPAINSDASARTATTRSNARQAAHAHARVTDQQARASYLCRKNSRCIRAQTAAKSQTDAPCMRTDRHTTRSARSPRRRSAATAWRQSHATASLRCGFLKPPKIKPHRYTSAIEKGTIERRGSGDVSKAAAIIDLVQRARTRQHLPQPALRGRVTQRHFARRSHLYRHERCRRSNCC